MGVHAVAVLAHFFRSALLIITFIYVEMLHGLLRTLIVPSIRYSKLRCSVSRVVAFDCLLQFAATLQSLKPCTGRSPSGPSAAKVRALLSKLKRSDDDDLYDLCAIPVVCGSVGICWSGADWHVLDGPCPPGVPSPDDDLPLLHDGVPSVPAAGNAAGTASDSLKVRALQLQIRFLQKKNWKEAHKLVQVKTQKQAAVQAPRIKQTVIQYMTAAGDDLMVLLMMVRSTLSLS